MKIEKIIEKNAEGNKIRLVLEGWLDTAAAPELESALKDVPAGTGSLEFDCEKLEYISSSGIRQIVAAHKQMNGNLVLTKVNEDIRSVLDITGISKHIRME